MKIERTFYCSAPECDGSVKTANKRPQSGVFVQDYWPGGRDTFYFCHWDCALKYAAGREPVEIIPFHHQDETE
jgi:hypothetical protein